MFECIKKNSTLASPEIRLAPTWPHPTPVYRMATTYILILLFTVLGLSRAQEDGASNRAFGNVMISYSIPWLCYSWKSKLIKLLQANRAWLI